MPWRWRQRPVLRGAREPYRRADAAPGHPASIGALPLDLGRRSLAHIKAGAGIDTSEKRRPQDGALEDRPECRRPARQARHRRTRRGHLPHRPAINFIPTLYGEDVALRLLRRDDRLGGLDALGMTDEQLSAYSAMIESPSGLILITGPTGSGKTSTLYSSLLRIQSAVGGTRKINTIEDPVEYALEGLRQSQVNPLIGLGFADLLRSILRQSPDVIMIGEVRDPETAETAIRAANSGVLASPPSTPPAPPPPCNPCGALAGIPISWPPAFAGSSPSGWYRPPCAPSAARASIFPTPRTPSTKSALCCA